MTAQMATRLTLRTFKHKKRKVSNSLMYGIPSASIRKLHRVQNSVVRLVLGVKGYHVNIDDLRRTKLHWLPVKDRIVFKILLLTYKSLNGLAPAYLSDHSIQIQTPSHPSLGLSMSSEFSTWHLHLLLRGTRFRCLSTKVMERSTSFHQERSFRGCFQETVEDSPV